MICADPWDEAVRLEALLEAELLGTNRAGASRIPPAVFAAAEVPASSPDSIRRGRPHVRRRSTLGFLYAGCPYTVDHI